MPAVVCATDCSLTDGKIGGCIAAVEIMPRDDVYVAFRIGTIPALDTKRRFSATPNIRPPRYRRLEGEGEIEREKEKEERGRRVAC